VCSCHYINFEQCKDINQTEITCSRLNRSSFLNIELDRTNFPDILCTLLNLSINYTNCEEKLLQELKEFQGLVENGNDGDSACHTNCSITMVNSCSASVLKLQDVWFKEAVALPGTSRLINGCSIEINCCYDGLSPSSFPSSTTTETRRVTTYATSMGMAETTAVQTPVATDDSGTPDDDNSVSHSESC